MTDFELGYIAGMLDGEGCISIMRRKQKRSYGRGVYTDYSIHVTVATGTVMPTLQWIQARTGGTIYTQKMRGNRKDGHRLTIYKRDEALKFLRIISPYLLTKKVQAEVAMEFLGLCSSFNPERRATLHMTMMGLNKRGIVEQNGEAPRQSQTLQ